MNLRYNFDRVLFRLLRKFRFTRDTMCVVRGGPLQGYEFTVRIDNRFLFGTYEPESVAQLSALVQPHDVVYDLGANVGYYALVVSKLTENTVHAFEPIPTNVRLMREHIRRNGISNVVVHELAVSDHVGTIEFSNSDALVSNTYVADSDRFRASSHKISVPTTSVDALVYGDAAIAPPDVMKIDVEGAEFDVLLGAQRVIREKRPSLLLATHDSHLPGVTQRCLDWLVGMRYQCTPMDAATHTAGHTDFVCVPLRV